MSDTILTQTHTFVKASDGSILVGASPLEVLTWMAGTHASRIKLFDTYGTQAVKFMGAVVKEVEITADTYDQFVAHLRATGWQLRPQLTSGGFVATRAN